LIVPLLKGAITKPMDHRIQKSGARSQEKSEDTSLYQLYQLSRRRIRYSKFWMLTPEFHFYIICVKPNISDLAQRTRFLIIEQAVNL